MKFPSKLATALLPLALATTALAPEVQASSARSAAVAECNSRIQQGIVPPIQSAFDQCVRQVEPLFGAIMPSHNSEFCRGVRDGIRQEGVALNSAVGQLAQQMAGCL